MSAFQRCGLSALIRDVLMNGCRFVLLVGERVLSR